MRNFGFIKCLVCLIAIGLILTQKLNAQEFIPEFDVQALTSVISVDGDKTDWEAIEELPMNPVSGMEFYNGKEDCRLSYKVTWDADKLYLLVDITDPEAIIYGDENITESPEPYSVDNIEFFLDLDNSDNAKMDNKNDFQIRMPRKSEYIPGAEGWPNGLGTIPSMMNSPGSTSEYDHQKGFVEGFGFEISKMETETGWILEAAFPWEVLLKVDENLTPADMADGTQIGVMLQYQDRDALDVKDRTKFLNLEEGSWNNPAGWGTMTLKGEPGGSEPVFRPEFDVQALTSVISVDGDKTDWEAIEELPMNPVSGMEFYNGKEDCRLSYKVTWDADKLYLLVDITDPEAIIYGDENITESPEPYSVDNIEFFLDLDNSDNAKMDNKNDFQIRMPRKSEYIPGAEGWPNGLGTIPSMMNSPGSTSEYDHQKGFVEGFGFEISKMETETGWILEAAFSWEVLLKVDENLTPVDMADGTQIGVMVQYQDRDALDVKDRTKFLNLEEGSWNNPAGWGTMTLKGGSSEPSGDLITIDGIADDKWEDAPKFELKTIVNIAGHEPHQVQDENDLSGYFKAMWEEEYLYILGVVKDDVLVATENSNNSDNCNVYIDPENTKLFTDPTHVSIGYMYGNDTLFGGRTAPGWNNPPYYERAAKDTEDGYIVEFKLPADSIRLDKLEVGM